MCQIFNRIEAAAFKFSILQSLSFHPFPIEKLESDKKVGIQKLESKTTIVVFDELNCQLSPTKCGVVKDIRD